MIREKKQSQDTRGQKFHRHDEVNGMSFKSNRVLRPVVFQPNLFLIAYCHTVECAYERHFMAVDLSFN